MWNNKNMKNIVCTKYGKKLEKKKTECFELVAERYVAFMRTELVRWVMNDKETGTRKGDYRFVF